MCVCVFVSAYVCFKLLQAQYNITTLTQHIYIQVHLNPLSISLCYITIGYVVILDLFQLTYYTTAQTTRKSLQVQVINCI